MTRPKICAYTAVCEEDACWIPQYLDEVERLEMPFCVLLDNCSRSTRDLFCDLRYRPYLRGIAERNDTSVPFSETDKQHVFDLAVQSGADWAMAWDIDEIWEPEFWQKVGRLDPETMDCVDCPWLNAWGDRETVRIDGAMSMGHRVKFYNLRSGISWLFKNHLVNGAYGTSGRKPLEVKAPVCCVHHGLMTRELRVQHKDRWDKIYGHWSKDGRNPYGFWDFALNTDEQAITCPLSERLKEYK